MATETFTSDDTWTCPEGVTVVQVECWGGGGGGGVSAAGEGGGGGGAYAITNAIPVDAGEDYTVTVGAGGGPGIAGGDSWFIDTGEVLAKGGSAGNARTGGTGGQAASCVGDQAYNGGNGGTASGINSGGGGGGSSGGTGANGNNGAANTLGAGGAGGTAPAGGGAGANGGTFTATGGTATEVGGGGGGGSASANAGSGFAGKVVLTYTVEEEPEQPAEQAGTGGTSIPWWFQTKEGNERIVYRYVGSGGIAIGGASPARFAKHALRVELEDGWIVLGRMDLEQI